MYIASQNIKWSIIFILLFFPFLDSFYNCFGEISSSASQQNNTEDSIPKKRASGTLKINPILPIFSEIPISFEIYITEQKSLHIQAGYIFTGPEALKLNGWGEDGNDINTGIFSYRTNPYNNDGGIDLKIEFRMYKHSLGRDRKLPYKSFYFGPQFTYKYFFYNNQTHYLKYHSQYSYRLTESKDCNVFGLGIMYGRQTCRNRFVFDLYGGLGLRMRLLEITIHERHDYWGPPNTTYPSSKDMETSYYPFINFGLRLGFEL